MDKEHTQNIPNFNGLPVLLSKGSSVCGRSFCVCSGCTDIPEAAQDFAGQIIFGGGKDLVVAGDATLPGLRLLNHLPAVHAAGGHKLLNRLSKDNLPKKPLDASFPLY